MNKMRKILIVLLILLLPALILKAIDNYFSDRTTTFINKQIQTHASFVIANVISKQIVNELETENILQIKYNNQDIESLIINTKVTNSLLGNLNEEVMRLLATEELEKAFGKIEFPLGYLFSQNILASYGPKIKVPIKPLGTYRADIVTLTKEFGINNSLIEVYLVFDIDLEALFPLSRRKLETKTKILLALQTIQGEVPRYYGLGNIALSQLDD